MAAATEPSVYDGTAGAVKTTTLLTRTAEDFMPKFREFIFTGTPFLKSLALTAFGGKAFNGEPGSRFGNVTRTDGKGIKFNDGGHQFSFPFLTSAYTSSIVGRMDNINPQYNDPGGGGAYAWVRQVIPMMIPEEAIKDNQGKAKLMDWMETEMKLGQMSMIRDVNYTMLGHSSAPTGAPYGLNNLVSVTQTRTIGGYAATNSDWQNIYEAQTTVGGGGELDRPLALKRKLDAMVVKTQSYTGGDMNAKWWVCTTGAYQYMQRLSYADNAHHGLAMKEYDGYLDHIVWNGRPVIYDPSVQEPYGATASTEAIYCLDYSELGINIKRNEYFAVEPWEAPRTKDRQRYYQSNIWLRYTPYVTNRRIQGVIYNLPANGDTI